MANLTIDHAAIVPFVNAHIGPTLDRQADRLVKTIQNNINVPYVRGESNPPPNFPRKRTGDLYYSIRHAAGDLKDGLISREVFSEATHFGHPYPRILHDQGYTFIEEDDLALLAASPGSFSA